MAIDDIHFIQDYPFKVDLYGCRGTIYSLREAGWRLATQVTEDVATHRQVIRLSGEHTRDGSRLLSAMVYMDIPFMREYGNISEVLEHTVIPVAAIAKQITIAGEMSQPYASWQPFNAMGPSMVTIQQTDFNPRCIPFFSNSMNTTELILPEKSVSEMLKEIMDKQEPLQAELREQRIREREKIHGLEQGQLIHLPNVTRRVEILAIGGN